ncbi:hypothetical protein GW17_00029070, partial [Ensete ventricosum]
NYCRCPSTNAAASGGSPFGRAPLPCTVATPSPGVVGRPYGHRTTAGLGRGQPNRTAAGLGRGQSTTPVGGLAVTDHPCKGSGRGRPPLLAVFIAET